MDSQGWLLPLGTLLLGSSGIAAYLGLAVQRQSNKATAAAAAVAHAIDALTRVSQEQRAELDRLNEVIEERDARIRTLENARRRQQRRDK